MADGAAAGAAQDGPPPVVLTPPIEGADCKLISQGAEAVSSKASSGYTFLHMLRLSACAYSSPLAIHCRN